MGNAGYFFYRNYYDEGFFSLQEEHKILNELKNMEKEKKYCEKQLQIYFEKKHEKINRACSDKDGIEFKKIEEKSKESTFGEGGKSFTFQIATLYPGLLLGSGYSHDMSTIGASKLGFFFDHTTGVPVIPGSSVKGLIRSVFPRFEDLEIAALKKDGSIEASIDFLKSELFNKGKEEKKIVQAVKAFKSKCDEAGYAWCFVFNEEKEDVSKENMLLLHSIEKSIFEGVDQPIYSRDIFFDAYPKTEDNNHVISNDFITPHHENQMQDPNPIQFLKIMPGVEFTFGFIIHDTVLSELTLTSDEKEALFRKIILMNGIGSKTNVGYGQFGIPKADDQKNKKIIKESTLIEKIPNNLKVEGLNDMEGYIEDMEDDYALATFELTNNSVLKIKKKKESFFTMKQREQGNIELQINDKVIIKEVKKAIDKFTFTIRKIIP